WMQVRSGQALTGHVPDDDRMIVLRGGGENAKSTMLGAIQAAFGDYAVLLSDKVLLGDTRDHSTEMMDLRGARLAFIAGRWSSRDSTSTTRWRATWPTTSSSRCATATAGPSCSPRSSATTTGTRTSRCSTPTGGC